MLKHKFPIRIRTTALYGCVALTLALYSLGTLFLPNSVKAAPIMQTRKVTISSSKADATGVSYTFSFNKTTSTDVQSIVFQFCDTPLGTCTLPGTDGSPSAAEKIDVSHVTASYGSISGWTTATAFSEYTGADAGACTESDGGSGVATMWCATRTETTDESTGVKTFTVNNISNPILTMGTNSSFESVYVRITLYSDTAFATPVDEGTVAAGITQQLTVDGRVQERLEFCVSAIDDDDSLPASCSAMPATTTIDVGVIDNSGAAVSPVEPSATNGSNDDYGIAMINTNASLGVVLTYFPQQASTGTNQLRAFRVNSASCDAASSTLTDQCFRPAATTGTDYSSADGERFGLHIPCIDTTQGTTTNLGSVPGAYNNADNNTASATNCEAFDGLGGGSPDTGDEFAFDDSGTATTLASSSSVVDDEIVKLRYGAIASATTPTGSYTIVTEFIATPTF